MTLISTFTEDTSMQSIESPASASPIPATVATSLVLIVFGWAASVGAAAHWGLLAALGRAMLTSPDQSRSA